MLDPHSKERLSLLELDKWQKEFKALRTAFHVNRIKLDSLNPRDMIETEPAFLFS